MRRLFAVYRSGTAIEKILLRYPQLSAAQVFDALAFALDNPEVMAADSEREGVLLESKARRAASPPAVRQAEFDFSGEDAASPSREPPFETDREI